MNNLKTWLLFATAIFTALLFTACTDEDDTEGSDAIPAELIGTWTLNNDETITFYEDGTGEYVYYEDDGMRASAKQPGATESRRGQRGTYQVTTYFDYTYKVATRQIIMRTDGKRVVWTISTYTDGRFTIVDQNGVNIILESASSPDTGEVPLALIGTWINDSGDNLIFRADGTGRYVPADTIESRSPKAPILKRLAQHKPAATATRASTKAASDFSFTYDEATAQLVLTGENNSYTLAVEELTGSILSYRYEGSQLYTWRKLGGGSTSTFNPDLIPGNWGWAYTRLFNFSTDNILTIYNYGYPIASFPYSFNTRQQAIVVEGLGTWPIARLSEDIMQVYISDGYNSELQTVFRMTDEPWTVGSLSMLQNKEWYTMADGDHLTFEFYSDFTGVAKSWGNEEYADRFTYTYNAGANTVTVYADGEYTTLQLLRLTDTRLVVSFIDEEDEDSEGPTYIEMAIVD